MFGRRGTNAETWALRTVVVLGAVVVVVPAVLVLVETVGWLKDTSPIVAPVEHLLGPICHHIPERTLVIGRPLPVCARCTGLYAGWVIGAPVAGWLATRVSRLGRGLVVLGGLFVVGVVEAVIERLGLIAVSNAARAVLGLPLGLAPSIVVGVGGLILARQPPVAP